MNMHLTTLSPVSTQTMSSLEIADRTAKDHRNVMRDIRVMLIALHGAGGLLRFEHSYRNAQNKEQPCFNLPKRECLILVSGYSVTLRAAIIDRWAELEAQAPRLPQSFAEALQLAADQARQIEQKDQQLALQAPKVAMADLV